jgi:hypothetical protein
MDQDKANQFSKFKKNVKEFLKLDEEVRILSKARSERTKNRDLLAKEIMNYYRLNKINTVDLNTDDGKELLELIESKRKPSVNQKFLRTALEKYCKDDQIVDHMIEHILEQRSSSEVSSFKLKRIMPKKKSSQTSPQQLADIQKRFAMLTQFSLQNFNDINNDINNEEDTEENTEDTEENTEENTEEAPEVLEVEETLGSCNNLEHLANEIVNSNIFNKESSNIKDNIKDNTRTSSDINDMTGETFNIVKKESSNIKEVKDVKMGEVKADVILSDDEDEVILDDIPVEETGCESKPVIVDEPEQIKPISNYISEKLEKMSENQFAGAIPKPGPMIPIKQLESFALDSWKRLESMDQKYPILTEWLKLQKNKLVLIRDKNKYQQSDFNNLLIKIDQKEKEYPRMDPEIEKDRIIIKKYIIQRFTMG